jgi:hypothetical protein
MPCKRGRCASGGRMFAKIFKQIYDSSLVENPETRFTFMDFLILADRNGVVDVTHDAIARRTNRPIELIRQTISELEGPDPMSRTPDANGARIFRLDEHRDWGWGIVNYQYFRKIASDEQRREKTRLRVARFRKKEDVTQCNAVETQANDAQRMKRHAEAEAEAEAEVKETRVAPTQTLVWSRAEGFDGITADLHQEWKIAYPACNIDRQLADMHQWLMSNPAKAKKTNWRQFVTNWLRKQQNRGGDIPSVRTEKRPPSRQSEAERWYEKTYGRTD